MRDAEMLRSLITRVGAVAETDRADTLILTKREYAALDAAAHVADSDIAQNLEETGVLLDPGAVEDHRTEVDEEVLPK